MHCTMIYSAEIGVTSDSLGYMRIAEGVSGASPFFANGKVLSHWPPLYQLSLAAVSDLFEVSSLASAKILSIILAFFFILLFNILIKNWHKDFRSIFFANLFLIGSSAIGVFQLALSEGLFMCFLLLLLILIDKTSKPVHFLFIGALCGLMVLTRYAGLGIVAGLGLFLLWQFKSIKKIAFLGIGFLISISPWILFTQWYHGSVTSREASMHLPAVRHAKGLIGTFYRFINPSEILWVGLVSILLVTVLVWWHRRHIITNIMYKKITKHVYTWMAIVYFIFLLISISFFDFKTPLNVRMLFPVYLIGLLLVINLMKKKVFVELGIKTNMALALLAIAQVVSAAVHINDFVNYGEGFTSTEWRTSPTIAIADDFYARKVYSNAASVLQFYGVKKAIGIPAKVNPKTTEPLLDYKAKYAQMIIEVQQEEAVIILLTNKKWWYYLPSLEDLSLSLSESKKQMLKDGIIYY